MVYVAFLRGVNVVGNSRVEMLRLKKLFESLGFDKVVTYINSGNVVFAAYDGSTSQLRMQIEGAIDDEFGFTIPVVVMGLNKLRYINDSIPISWENNGATKTDVMFLKDNINNSSILNKIGVNPNIETLKYCDGALVWNIDRNNLSKSKVPRLINTELYSQMTIRNINTLRKLMQIAEQIQ